MRLRIPFVALTLASGCLQISAQGAPPEFEGMWSDPPATAVDYFCFAGCTVRGRDYLVELLDDPDNLERPYTELAAQARAFQKEQHIRDLLTPAARKRYPFDPALDPVLLACKPWGFSRQIFVPHQLEIRQHDDIVTFHYAEWDARRTIYLDGRTRPADQLPATYGYSTGRYEGDTLVVETTGISPHNFLNSLGGVEFSDQLRVMERYSRSDDGNRLEVIVALEDPLVLQAPLMVTRAWAWAPDEEIYEYNCELYDE